MHSSLGQEGCKGLADVRGGPKKDGSHLAAHIVAVGYLGDMTSDKFSSISDILEPAAATVPPTTVHLHDDHWNPTGHGGSGR